MSDTSNDAGMIQVLLDRFNNQRLPRMLELKAKAERGEKLTDYELEFLEQHHALAGSQGATRSASQHLQRHPEFTDLVSRIAALYKEIATKALANESKP